MWVLKRPWGKHSRQQEERKKKKHHCNYAFSEYSTHSSPLFLVWKCSHESSSMLLDEAVTSTVLLCLFYGCTWNLIHHSPNVIMEISGDLLGVLQQQSAISTKDPEVSEGRRKDFHINTRVCSCIWTVFTVFLRLSWRLSCMCCEFI